MIPKDLSGFSIEQLRGFQTAVKLNIDEVRPEAIGGDPEKLATLETLLNQRELISSAIEALQSADNADDAENVDETADANADDASDETVDEDAENVDASTDNAENDVDAIVEDAVATATMGGGQGPKVTSEPAPRSTDMRKFIRAMTSGEVRGEMRASFATMQRETNHRLAANGRVDKPMLQKLREDRASGNDKTAAGCFCGPDEARNEIAYSGVTDRPLSDTLPTITANGDYQFVRQIPWNDAGVGVTTNGWFCEDQDAVDPDDESTWKPIMDLDCEDVQTSETYAVAAAARFNVQQMIGNPALIDNLEHVMRVVFNQRAEYIVWNRLLANSSQYNYALHDNSGYGASSKFIAAVAWAMELVRQNVRSMPQGYNLALPAGLKERLLGDGMVRATDDYRTWDDIVTRLDELGVSNVVEMIDTINSVTGVAVEGAAPIAALPHDLNQPILLYKPEDFLLGLNPEVDLGIMRSPELARMNKVQWFTESFESVEKVGIEPSVLVNLDLCLSGIRPAFGEGTACDEA